MASYLVVAVIYSLKTTRIALPLTFAQKINYEYRCFKDHQLPRTVFIIFKYMLDMSEERKMSQIISLSFLNKRFYSQ